ncbi:CHAT domain-containing protein [Kamptonema animale CS-326]|uniref:tetratricopeptide repeat protein n=1 Tax=Kamptonema animale TaxID=92934 RepID=UPI00232E1487|nr:tetratricopeptide repeat protein [Kamptonema animale]MDB9514613.1 CHAT domain-containing protein [Kamptonema animale CS-326]
MQSQPGDIKAYLADQNYNLGIEYLTIGDYLKAYQSLRSCLEAKPNNADAWIKLGIACQNLGRYNEAITANNNAQAVILGNPIKALIYEEAVKLFNQADSYHAEEIKGVLATYQKAIEIDPNDHYAWNRLGADLCDNLGRYEEAITAFDKALEIDPNFHLARNGLGNTLHSLERYSDALVAFDKALKIDPNSHGTWYNRGMVLTDLECYSDALVAFDKALEIDRSFHLAWNGLGATLKNLERYSEAIAAFDKALEITQDQFWEAWFNRGWAFFYSGDYLEAIHNWDEGLKKYLPINHEYRLACGKLHQHKGKAHYEHGKQTATYLKSFPKAKASYKQACEYLTSPLIPEAYLEVLKDLIIVCLDLGDFAEADEYLNTGTTLLEHLLLDPNTDPLKKLQLQRKFPEFYQLEVDKLVRLDKWDEALQKAEKRKNSCLKWMREGWQTQIDSPTFPQMQELLKNNPQTAIIYWHLSPVTLTTFIITPEKFEAISTPINPIDNDKNQTLEKWLQDWKTRYQDSRKTKGEKAPAETNSWQENLESSLEELGKLLNIAKICDQHLSGINQLIFIPHRDLHLLPLHALFSPEKYTTIYLPSAQIGIDRKNRPATNPTAQLLCIKHPGNDEKNKLLFADVEAPAISLLCNGELIEDEDATLDRVLPQIPTSGYLHFTCHGIHDFKTPINSALELHSKLLTLEDIFKLQELPSCHLVCLSACETGLTSTKDLLDEFIGLSSSFLAIGATYVVSTLWSVEDISSTLLMVKFYQLLFAEKLTPPTALKKAQDWLRTATYDLLIKWYNKLIPEVSNSRRCRGNLEDLLAQVVKEAEEKGLDYQPYSDCYHWAGFIITGKIPD